MGQVLPEVAVLVGEEAPVWEDPGEEEWVAPEPEQARAGNACVRSAERRLHMKSEFPATLRNAPSAEQRW